jgi:DNA polymerase-3 subunit beta
MRFNISKTVLSSSLSLVNSVTERKNTIPILKNVKLEIIADKLLLSATDMDILSESKIDILEEENGKTTVPAQLFYDIVKKIPDDKIITVNLDQENSQLKIEYDKSKFSIPSLDTEEFPILGDDDMDIEFEMPAVELAKLIDNTKFAMATDETRHYINGIFLHSIKDEEGKVIVKIAATDGHRLAVSSSSLSTLKDEISGVIIPKKTVHEIRKTIESKKDVKILISRTKIKIITGNNILISKVVDADFPDYKRIIPQDNNNIATINKKEFSEAIDRVATVIITKDHKTLKLLLTENNVKLSASTNDGSFADEELAIQYDQENFNISFNPQYLLEILNHIKEDKIQLKLKNDTTPALISSADSNNIYVILPIRV